MTVAGFMIFARPYLRINNRLVANAKPEQTVHKLCYVAYSNWNVVTVLQFFLSSIVMYVESQFPIFQWFKNVQFPCHLVADKIKYPCYQTRTHFNMWAQHTYLSPRKPIPIEPSAIPIKNMEVETKIRYSRSQFRSNYKEERKNISKDSSIQALK